MQEQLPRVLSFPDELRLLLAQQPAMMGKVLEIVYRTLAIHLVKKGGFNKRTAHTGAVTLIQRFGRSGVPVCVESIKSPSLKNFFNSLPTSLELTNRQVDSLIVAGRTLLRENPEFQAFLAASKGELKEKNTRSSCNPFLNPLCIIR